MTDGDNFHLYSRILFKSEPLFKRKAIVNFKDSEDHIYFFIMWLLKPLMETRPVILQNDVALRGCGCTIKSFKAIILKLGFES